MEGLAVVGAKQPESQGPKPSPHERTLSKVTGSSGRGDRRDRHAFSAREASSHYIGSSCIASGKVSVGSGREGNCLRKQFRHGNLSSDSPVLECPLVVFADLPCQGSRTSARS
eukprot:250537-Amphidinium_carterae.1